MTEGTEPDKDGNGGMAEDTLEAVEAEELERVVGMLAFADPDEIDVWAAPPPDLEDRIIDRIRAEQNGKVVGLAERREARQRRVPRVLVAAAAAVVAIVLAVGVASIVDRDSNGGGADPDAVALAGTAEGITGSAAITQGDSATEIHLVASGLEPDEVYAAWLAPAEGDRVPAGTFRTDANGEIEADLLSSFPLSSAARVWVTDPAGETVLKAPLT
jgi:hypothetical protein